MSSLPTRTRPYARVLRPLGVGTVVLGLSYALTSCSGSAPAAPTFDTVTRGDISTGVTASGALAARTSEQLGFAQGGRLTSVKVKVGQKVEKGDVLATIDSKVARETLKQAEAGVDAQAAALARDSDDPSVQSAAASLAQARTVVARTNSETAATADADAAAVSRAKEQKSTDEDAKDDAEDAADSADDACDSATAIAKQAGQAADAAANAVPANANAAALATLAASAAGTATSTCGAAGSAEAGVTAARQRVTADETTIVTAEQRRRVDAAAGRLACASAEQGVVTARNAYNSAVAARPHTLDAAQAGVDGAQAQVDAAQKAVDDTTLRAPSAGTISVVNGSKGEYVSASTGTSALAPGSGAAIPGASGSGGAAAAAGAASPSRPGGSQFIVLSGLDTLQVVLPFEESDAALIKAGQGVDVQLDAIPDLTAHGTVVAVSPSATPISGVVSYYATVSLDQRDPRERDGQTARATVLTDERTGVLTVPNTAVKQQGDASTVVLYDANGDQRTVPVQTGLVGTDRTEIVSGLNEGDRVVVPSHP